MVRVRASGWSSGAWRKEERRLTETIASMREVVMFANWRDINKLLLYLEWYDGCVPLPWGIGEA